MEWSVKTARQCVDNGSLEQWLDSYLSFEKWANIELRDGLKKAPRWWKGPVLIPIEKLIRNCGPEMEMAYKVPLAHWEHKTGEMADKLKDSAELPPIIVQCIDGAFYMRDGNHRLEAARKKGWSSIWALIWFDHKEDWLSSPP